MLPFAFLLFGNFLTSTSLVTKAASNPYPILFPCQGCSCINQAPLLETFAINPINKQKKKNANLAVLAPANLTDSEPDHYAIYAKMN